MSAGDAALLDRLRGQLAEVRRLRDETRALASRQLLPGSTGLVLAQLPRETTLAEAAGRIAEAYNLLHGGFYNRVTRQRGEVRLTTDDRDFAFAVGEGEAVLAVMEETLFFTHALLALVAPGPAREGLVGIALRRPRGRPAVPFGEFARTRLGAAAYALRYDAAAADVVVARPAREDLTYEAVVRTQLTLLGEVRGGARSLRERTLALLRAGRSDQGAVAAALGVSPATLRRRLADEGESFRALRQEVIRERADALLGTALPLPEIAERLGFSDVRSFNRAYSRLAGQTPARARQRR